MISITVFTPSYNRASYLKRIYESLLAQSSHDFEWLIVDDGSTDNTRQVVDSIIASNETNWLNIRYFYKQNGGKHTAINLGAKEALGELFLILDSDDSLHQNAIEFVINQYKPIRGDERFAGVCGLMAHHDGTLISSRFPSDSTDWSSIDMALFHNATGDRLEVFRTEILRKFPFPEIPGERFCPESLVWNRIGRNYKLRCFNQVLYYRDYLDGGLTDNIIRVRMNSPIGAMINYSEICQLRVPLKQRIKAAINYWRFRLCLKDHCPIHISSIWSWVLPISWLMHITDIHKTRLE